MSQRGIAGSGGELFHDSGQDGLMHRAFLRGAGFSAEDVRNRPVIGIANSASELNPCNLGLNRLAAEVKRGIREAGGLPIEFPTISISEPFTRPTSMFLRNLMSMDVEEMITAAPIDGVVLLGGCDKTIPAQLMGALSANKPATLLAAGPRPTSCHRGISPLTVDDAWPFCDRRRVGEVDDAEWQEFEGNLNTDVGTCNVMGTASSMAAIAAVLGFALPDHVFADSVSLARRDLGYRTGLAAVAAVQREQKPSDLVNLASLENAFRAITALGGSTNAIIHLEAIAGRAGVEIGMERFEQWSRSTPYLTNVRPGGEMTLNDLEDAGSLPALLTQISDLLHGEQRTVHGERWADLLAATEAPAHNAIRLRETPISAQGPLVVLRGNLAPNGAILKTAGIESDGPLQHRGKAVVFNGLEDLNERIDDPDLVVDASSVLVLRGLGPIGAPGMPEVGHIPIPAKLMQQGVTEMVRISDARMSGTSTGAVVLHVSPEAAAGGPLAYLRDGDEVVLDTVTGRLDHLVDEAEYRAREPFAGPARPSRGFAQMHFDHVLQADQGCDFDFLRNVASTGSNSTNNRLSTEEQGGSHDDRN